MAIDIALACYINLVVLRKSDRLQVVVNFGIAKPDPKAICYPVQYLLLRVVAGKTIKSMFGNKSVQGLWKL